MDRSDKQPKPIRLREVAGECNIGLHTLVEFLWQRGHEVDGGPNTKIPYALYLEVLSAFQQEKEFRERSREAFAGHQARHAIGQIVSDMNGYWITQTGTAPPNATVLVHDKAVEVKDDANLTADKVILIDIFLAFKDPQYQHYQDLGGIALLKFLRIKGVKNHIVLLSPWSLAELLRMDPGYHVLASEGITIAQYTHSQDELKDHARMPLKDLKPIPKNYDLRPWFKAGISLPKDERHNWANWWGVDRLWYVHEFVEGRSQNNIRTDAATYPALLKSRIRELRSQELLFCRGLPNEIDHNMSDVIRKTKGVVNGKALMTLRHELRQRRPRVMMIDDQAEEGWSAVMQNVIYGSDSDAFRSIAPKAGQLVDETYYRDHICPVIVEHAPQVVLLDLRLSRESESGIDVDGLSGARILSLLRRDHPGLPVIMTTASNKAWSFERLLRLGCDAYWIKEGIELDPDPELPVLNYARLLELIERSTSEVFERVKEFGVRIQTLKATIEKCWWEPTDQGVQKGAEREVVFGILDEAMYLLRDHLASVELGRLEYRPKNPWFYPSLIVLHLSKVIEMVHNSFEAVAIGSTDYKGKELMFSRNSVAHGVTGPQYVSVTKWDHDRLFTWLDDFMGWLSNPPTAFPGVKVVGKIKL